MLFQLPIIKPTNAGMAFVWLTAVIFCGTQTAESRAESLQWSDAEIATVTSLSLAGHPQKPPLNKSNPVGDHPVAKRLGGMLFFDEQLSANGGISCASCHKPELNFTDGKVLSEGLGPLDRQAPTLLGAGYQTWYYADGRRDSLWSQAITPLESANEMGSTRVAVVRRVLSHAPYRSLYEEIFGGVGVDLARLPQAGGPYGDKLQRKTWRYLSPNLKFQVNNAFANIGRVIAAYEREIQPQPGRLEKFAEQLQDEALDDPALTPEEQAGLKLFIDVNRTQCLTCHNGPMMTNGGFHNIGTATLEGEKLDLGRMIGLQAVMADEFNCFGPYSGIPSSECDALNFVDKRDSHSPLLGAYKVPTLRGLNLTAPYGHDGRFETLTEVIRHYQSPPDPKQYSHELKPIDLSEQEIDQLVKFLKVL